MAGEAGHEAGQVEEVLVDRVLAALKELEQLHSREDLFQEDAGVEAEEDRSFLNQ